MPVQPAFSVEDAGRMPPRTARYKNEALKLLKKEFSRISVRAVTATFHAFNDDFPTTYQALQNVRAIVSNPPNVGALEQRLYREYPFLRNVSKVHIKTRRSSPAFTITDRLLVNELEGIDELNQKENRDVPANNDDDANSSEREEHRTVHTVVHTDREGNAMQQAPIKEPTIECECCFGECPFDEMVQCTMAHIFCIQCLEHHVNEQFHGKNSTEFKCMDSSGTDSCQGVFNRAQLSKLPPEFQHNYDLKVARLEAERAGIGCTCPNCDYLGFSDQTFVQCPKCAHEFCKECKESSALHRNRTCDDVKQEKEADKKISATNQTAEAMTDAVVRKCPLCGLQCFKEDGCNRMTCPNQNCPTIGSSPRTRFCYICRQQIPADVGYGHFCSTPHCSHENCGKCVLFTNTKEDDKRAVREAGLAQIANLQGSEVDAASKLLFSFSEKQTGRQDVDHGQFRGNMQGRDNNNAAPRFATPPPARAMPNPAALFGGNLHRGENVRVGPPFFLPPAPVAAEPNYVAPPEPFGGFVRWLGNDRAAFPEPAQVRDPTAPPQPFGGNLPRPGNIGAPFALFPPRPAPVAAIPNQAAPRHLFGGNVPRPGNGGAPFAPFPPRPAPAAAIPDQAAPQRPLGGNVQRNNYTIHPPAPPSNSSGHDVPRPPPLNEVGRDLVEHNRQEAVQLWEALRRNRVQVTANLRRGGDGS